MSYLEHRRLISNAIRSGVTAAPPPWNGPLFLHAGGLFAVGFAMESDLVFICTPSGGGIFDPHTGHKIARDQSWEPDGQLLHGLTTSGFGPLSGQTIHLAGIGGGGLLFATPDGWRISINDVDPPAPSHVVLTHVANQRYESVNFIHLSDVMPLRTYGFSPSGRVLILAQGDGAIVWTRQL